MAFYIDKIHVKLNTNDAANPKYKKIWRPGENPDYPGLYRCQSCGYEDVINRECKSLPPCSECRRKIHATNTWKLLVKAED